MISVIVPVYNEEGNIFEVIKNIKNTISEDDEIIVVDDGSLDQTVNEIKKTNCVLLENKINLGKGQSIINGLNIANGGIVLLIDGDGQDDPKEIPKLINGLKKGYDLVIGSRFCLLYTSPSPRDV